MRRARPTGRFLILASLLGLAACDGSQLTLRVGGNLGYSIAALVCRAGEAIAVCDSRQPTMITTRDQDSGLGHVSDLPAGVDTLRLLVSQAHNGGDGQCVGLDVAGLGTTPVALDVTPGATLRIVCAPPASCVGRCHCQSDLNPEALPDCP